MNLKPTGSEERLTLVFVYSRDYAERVIRNLINDPSFCQSCGLYCDYCKYSIYSYVSNVRAAIQLLDQSRLPAFIDTPEECMPRRLPKADLCIASGLHKDLLLELPHHVQKFGIDGLIVPIENFVEVPLGLKRQMKEKCEELDLENAFPKPFCSLEPAEDQPIISKFVTELKVGRPLLGISTVDRDGYEVIDHVIVKRSAPCGSTWYVAKRLIGVETRRKNLYDAVAKAHHSYPCTASMNMDPELKEPILHVGGYIIREEVENALK